ncbi:MAG: site-specific DNA-methyltransferase, partial [Candidatus Poribacteria bacterium]|nr:site-specific DNA-methyltransferase [Candidatus Poribacteria bacterium]
NKNVGNEWQNYLIEVPFIEGDNLDALKLLQETYLGKVKMIYIDPPYNTGKDFIYADNFADSIKNYLKKSTQVDDDGNKLVANTDANGRFHSDWLTNIYMRLKLSRNLLTEDGLIFISIDNNELDNLIKLSKEVFGEKNFVSVLVWKSGRTAAAHFTNEHEYIVCFAKNKDSVPLFKYKGYEPISDRAIKRPTSKNPISRISFPAGIDFDSEDKVFPNEFGGKEPVKIVEGIFQCKNGKLANDVVVEAAWTMKDMIEGWIRGENIIDQKGQVVSRFFFKSNGILQYEKQKGTVHPKSIITGFTTKQGGKAIEHLLGANYFEFPKPIDLIVSLAEAFTESGDIILDFFAGSSTTAHAVMQLNAEDNSKRKFIMVQLPEVCEEKYEAFKAGYKTIAEISKERIRQAGKKIKEENATIASELDIGFRVLKIDSSNIADVYYTPETIEQNLLNLYTDNIKHDRTSEDLLFQVLLDWGIDLTLPVTKESIDGYEVFFVDGNTLVACFEKNGKITEDFCKELANRLPLRVIFRDSGFKDDNVRINIDQIFKIMSPNTDLKTI